MPSRAARAVLAAVLLTLGVLAPASQAQAAESSVAFRCSTVAFGVSYEAAEADYDIAMTLPGAVSNGASVLVRWSFDRLPLSPPINLAGVSFSTTASLVLSRPGHLDEVLEVSPSTPTVEVDLPGGSELEGPRQFSDFHQFVADNAGDVVTVKPGLLHLEYLTGDEGIAGAKATCVPVDEDVVLASVTVNGPPEPCVLDSSCAGDQTFVGDVIPDALSIDHQPDPDAEWPTSIALPAIETDSERAEATVESFRFGRVTDSRSTPTGWSLTATANALESESGAEIPAAAISIVGLTCASPVGSSGSAPATAGPGGSLEQARVLCSVQTGDLGPTGAAGGQWDVVGDVRLDVAPFTRSGLYSGVLTLVLA